MNEDVVKTLSLYLLAIYRGNLISELNDINMKVVSMQFLTIAGNQSIDYELLFSVDERL